MTSSLRGLACLVSAAALSLADAPERSLPLFFIPNRGQVDESVRFMVQTPGVRAGFTTSGVVLQIQGKRQWVRFPESNPAPRVDGQNPQPGRANFFLAGRQQTDLPLYGDIVYRDLYPGVDLVYSAEGARIKSEFHVAPGAHPSLIRLAYPGATVSVEANGDLRVTGNGIDLLERAPVVYQPSPSGALLPVPGCYRLIATNIVGFEIGEYDSRLPLVIDPVISYSTYLGGTGMGAVTGVAVDSSGNQYVTGWTEALDFPIVAPVYASNRGGVDVFVAKFNPAGNALLYATYFGGSGDDRGAAIAVNSSGHAYVAGSTTSSNFPVHAAYDSTYGGARDAFLFKLTAAGNSIMFSTYLGGTNWDAATAVALDSSGNAYVAGNTYSANFPVMSAAQSVFGGASDAFAAKFTAAGALSYSTFLGGSGDEQAGGIAVDSSDQAHVAGGTTSSNFPLWNPIQSSKGAGQDAFVTKLSAGGSSRIYSTYLGGNGGAGGSPEQVNAIRVDSEGAAYVAGATTSTDFPVTPGAFQSVYNGAQDAFAAKLSVAGSSLVYSTYLGGASFDWATGLAVDSSGNAHVAGYTSSSGFPVVGGVQAAFNGMYDGFVTKLTASGDGVTFSTFYGGSGSDTINAIALDPSGNMYIGGQTGSANFPLAGQIQSTNAGGSIGWAASIAVSAPPPQVPAAGSLSPSSGSGNTVTFTATYTHPAGAGSLTSAAILVNTAASTGFACYVSYSPASALFTIWNDAASDGATVLPGGGSAQNTQCTLNGAGSSASVNGTTLTLNVSLTFRPGFQGTKSVYLHAADAAANTGWIVKGSWTVTIPPPMPSADSVSPNASSGSSQTFTFVFSDTQDAANLTGMAVLFHSSVVFTNACYIVYDRNVGTVALLWDSAQGSTPKPLASTAVLQNSQCDVGSVSATISGLSVILTVSITFKPPFGGLRNIYMYATVGAANTGWVQRGTYEVTAGGFPVAQSVVPSSGIGPSQRFSFTVSDAGGSGYITGMGMLIAPTLNHTNACSLVWDRAPNTISLAYDNPANGASPIIPGSSSEVSNSQCALRAANSTVVYGTTSVVVTVDLLFNAAFAGGKTVYLYGAEAAANTGWVAVGTWTVTGGAPAADSISPSSGTGFEPSFTFTVSDSTFHANITGISMLFTTGSPANTANACYLVYNRGAGSIGLYDDSAATLSTKPIGSSATLQNSQCAVGYTVMNVSGTSVMFSANLLFKPAFSGAKSAYLSAQTPSASSGWVLRGSWTVP
jgi:hypothetical protein